MPVCQNYNMYILLITDLVISEHGCHQDNANKNYCQVELRGKAYEVIKSYTYHEYEEFVV